LQVFELAVSSIFDKMHEIFMAQTRKSQDQKIPSSTWDFASDVEVINFLVSRPGVI